MKQFLHLVLALTLVIALFTGCGSTETGALDPGDQSPAETAASETPNLVLSNPDGDTWTILVYLCGTDMETNGGFASNNLQEMAVADLPDKASLIIETGGTQQWAIDGIDAAQIQRWKVAAENLELVDSQPLANMGEAETLGSFLKWGVENYPADKYMCLMWDHGGGSVAGIVVDELHDGDMLNLKELAQGISMAGVQFELVGFGDALLAALFSAVPYKVAGEGRQRSNGLSVYVPLAASTDELDQYANLAATSGEYLSFLEGLYGWAVPEGVVISQPVFPTGQQASAAEQASVDDVEAAQVLNPEDFALSFTTALTEDGSILLSLTENADIASTVAFNLFYLDEESKTLWNLGSDFDVNQNDEGTQFWDNYRNVWTIINDNLCMMVALGFTDDYILYTVPVQVNGKHTNLRMLYHRDTAEYEVIGTWDGIDSESGMSSREVKKLQDGDAVEFVFEAYDLTTGEDASFVGGGFTVSGPVIAEEAILFDGVYYYRYEITDIFGNTNQSDFAMMTSADGGITVELMES